MSRAHFIPAIQVLQFHAQHRRLKTVHAIVVADLFMDVAGALGMFAQRARTGGKFLIVRQERAAFTIGAEVFCRIKTETGNRAELTDASALITRAMRLCRVLHDGQLVLLGNRVNGVHVGRQAEDVHGHDGLRAGRDGHFELGRVDSAPYWIDIDKHRRSADVVDGPGGGNEGKRRGDDFIAGTDVKTAQCEV